jgi:hypothetical protein
MRAQVRVEEGTNHHHYYLTPKFDKQQETGKANL